MLESNNRALVVKNHAVAVEQTGTHYPLKLTDRLLKRSFDILVAVIGIATLGWLMLLISILATIDTKQNGFFVQKRVGKDGKLFHTIKIRTMRNVKGITTTATAATDPRITRFGRFLRKTKLDELPQLINVLCGQMSLVGPRPDVPGFADQLTGEDRIILSIPPGITGPATLAFREEEKILAAQSDPEQYNREIIYPEKVRINREYITNYRFTDDIKYIIQTITR